MQIVNKIIIKMRLVFGKCINQNIKSNSLATIIIISNNDFQVDIESEIFLVYTKCIMKI